MPQSSKTAKFAKSPTPKVKNSKKLAKTKSSHSKASSAKVVGKGKKNKMASNRAMPPKRKTNASARSREYLSINEINAMRQAAKNTGRNGHRDDTLILLMFRHALRVSEAVALQWDQIDLKLGHLHVKRIKNGIPSTHPIRGAELRALRQLQRECSTDNPYVFISERKAPLTTRSVQHIVAKSGKAAGIKFTVHPHMLRHSTGFYLANKGNDTRAIQSYMGHANINNTVIYTELSPRRFNGFWDD